MVVTKTEHKLIWIKIPHFQIWLLLVIEIEGNAVSSINCNQLRSKSTIG